MFLFTYYLPTKLEIKRALSLFKRDALHRMGVNHGGTDVAMPQQLLNCPDIIIPLEQMTGKTVAKCMGRRAFGYPCLAYCLFDCLLNMRFMQMKATVFSCLALDSQLLGREKPFPYKLPGRIFIFLLQCVH